ncbi:hypothetical protein BDW74DRAFT_156252 [Aspergillus multicolor]|uniref:uncharacterized protein n=1 Tax=Aspergillus multicolor TaxID=41759 RepID=UPI003CCD0F82
MRSHSIHGIRGMRRRWAAPLFGIPAAAASPTTTKVYSAGAHPSGRHASKSVSPSIYPIHDPSLLAAILRLDFDLGSRLDVAE